MPTEGRPLPYCPKCGYVSGDDWRQCGGACPLSQSPYYAPLVQFVFGSIRTPVKE